MQQQFAESAHELLWALQARDLADKALASFVVIQAALKRSRRLWAYCEREDLNQRMPDFAVSALSLTLPQESLPSVHVLTSSCTQLHLSLHSRFSVHWQSCSPALPPDGCPYHPKGLQ